MSSSYDYHQQRPFFYVQIDEAPADTNTMMDVDEAAPQLQEYDYNESAAAAHGLLQLYKQSSPSQISLSAPSPVVSSHVQLNPINQNQQQEPCRLPSLSNLLLPRNIDMDHPHSTPPRASWNSTSTNASILYSSSSSGGDDLYSYLHQPTKPQQLIPPLSRSSSYSSLRSVASSHTSKANLLSRAATLASRRRGRPRKSVAINSSTTTTSSTTSTTTEFKIDMSSSYQDGPPTTASAADVKSGPASSSSPTTSGTTAHNKPRWQEAERLELLEAIVKEKNLDDMTSIRWDRISLAVGRAKKACKDQWRRELLPNLMRGFYGGSSNTKKKGSNHSVTQQIMNS